MSELESDATITIPYSTFKKLKKLEKKDKKFGKKYLNILVGIRELEFPKGSISKESLMRYLAGSITRTGIILRGEL